MLQKQNDSSKINQLTASLKFQTPDDAYPNTLILQCNPIGGNFYQLSLIAHINHIHQTFIENLKKQFNSALDIKTITEKYGRTDYASASSNTVESKEKSFIVVVDPSQEQTEFRKEYVLNHDAHHDKKVLKDLGDIASCFAVKCPQEDKNQLNIFLTKVTSLIEQHSLEKTVPTTTTQLKNYGNSIWSNETQPGENKPNHPNYRQTNNPYTQLK